MDFSSPSRALLSLDRRRPALDADLLSVSRQLLWPWKSGLFVEANRNPMLAVRRDDDEAVAARMSQLDDAAVLQQYISGIQALLGGTGSRWEALAVGLYCGTDLLTQQTLKQWPSSTTTTSGSTGSNSAVPPPSAANAAEGTMIYMEGPRVPTAIPNNNNIEAAADTPTPTSSSSNIVMSPEHLLELAQMLHRSGLEHLEHKEPRVRSLVAKAVGAHAALLAAMVRQGTNKAQQDVLTQQCQVIYKRVVASIAAHIEEGRKDPAEEEEEHETDARQATTQPPAPTPTDVSVTSSSSMVAVLDDTTGWRALETNWQCLACLIQPLGPLYLDLFPFEDDDNPDIDNNLLQHCQYSAVEHVNRHVRAAAMLVMEHWIRATTSTNATDTEARKAQVEALRNTAIEVLKHGLADNWSQVRMAASVLCRVFFLHFYPLNDNGTTTTTAQKEDAAIFLPILLPRMCLNRFYLAQGVKLYSHETWRMVFGNHGLVLVTQYVGSVCRYYTKMCDANNHVVREAGCQAIAELAVKLGGKSSTSGNDVIGEDEILVRQQRRQALQAFVPLLLQTLLMCFHDESWPVRDEACLACGIFCKSYPEECRADMNTLWERWTEQLTDQIWSVRQDAAVALADAMEAYGAEFLNRLLELIKKLLPSAKDQPAMTMEEYKMRQNDIESHTNSQMYSCGSLAPKLSKKSGAGRIGCSSCDITQPKAPWQATDGCIYLLRELVLKCCSADGTCNEALTISDNQLLPLMTELVDVCRVQHFPQADDLRATLWRQLPAIAQGLGKQRFKRLYLDVFIEPLMSTLERSSASQLSKHAAGQCAEELANLVGHSIFRGRLDDYQQRAFDDAMQERQQTPKGPGDGEAFSPFGPPGLLDHVVNNAGSPKSAMAMGPIGYP